jgi:hypothetical protein
MSFATEKMGERLPVVGQISPASYGAGTQLTAAIDMANVRRVLFVIQTGVLGASATVDFKITGSATSGGTYADVTGRSITQIVKASGDNKLALLEVTAEQVGAQGWRYIKGSLTVGTAASIVGVVALGDGLRTSEAGEFDVAAVAEIK